MTKIITISREFGSGGRELGKRLADELHFSYYDREIITAIAQKYELDETYVSNVLENGSLLKFSFTFGHTLSIPPLQENTSKVLGAQKQLLEDLANRGNCVIVGRSADVILEKRRPLNLFVYADMAAKVRRCQERAPQGENIPDHEMQKKIRQIDTGRARMHDLLSNVRWGAKEGYDLCINTTDLEIKRIVPALAAYAEAWFSQHS